MASTTGPAGSPGLEPAQAKTAAPRAAAVLARDLWFGFPGREPTLRGLDFEAHAGEVTVVLGSSGGGKTTLLRLIRGILTPSRGCGCRLGVVREWVIKRRKVEERRIRREDVVNADEIFLTNSWLGVMPIATLEGRPLGPRSIGPKLVGEMNRLRD